MRKRADKKAPGYRELSRGRCGRGGGRWYRRRGRGFLLLDEANPRKTGERARERARGRREDEDGGLTSGSSLLPFPPQPRLLVPRPCAAAAAAAVSPSPAAAMSDSDDMTEFASIVERIERGEVSLIRTIYGPAVRSPPHLQFIIPITLTADSYKSHHPVLVYSGL